MTMFLDNNKGCLGEEITIDWDATIAQQLATIDTRVPPGHRGEVIDFLKQWNAALALHSMAKDPCTRNRCGLLLAASQTISLAINHIVLPNNMR